MYSLEQLDAGSWTGSSSGGGGGSGTSKPVLTYAQTMDAVEHGTLTPNVLSAYEYYMGAPYQDDNQINSADDLGLTARTMFDNMVRRFTSANAPSFVNDIQKALNAGRITEAEADFIIGALGF